MTIITEQHLGHWSAWFEDHPELAFGGDSPATAATRLLSFRGIDPGAHQCLGICADPDRPSHRN